MTKDKIISLIQFAKRTNDIVYKQTLPIFIKKGQIKLIFVASDIGSASLKSVINFNDKSYKICNLFNKQELGNILSKDEVAIFAIKNIHIVKQIIKILDEKEV